ncbi:glycosyl transferase family 1 [Agrobacterium sp. TS43]|uniref:glycosyltransferase family 4 protein n=1 Tax=Agrobacterium TaxID=357 RepID=UPI0004A0BDDA|nr:MULTISPECIES: glycosyltransferase family 4 protein [Agrobacterium]KDR87061.1 glycosyl transferase family 1 [Agrobacterium tumefaciens GW4]KVK40540.1 glycosyl transferase family 1 [Agrobacterium sp. JL28]KVK41089.1 glycosyl transferase family 1 [Agrobacterium sp. LY4]KVK55148.1 glycosyl transferase family 1 [Agrobacterium sp. TS45]KVK57696.1 glycosyl transferase family 1 [Agrobacterium sp. C13]
MKVAFVSAIPAVPASEGNRSRILQLTRAVRSLGHEVHFVYVDTPIAADFDPVVHEAEFGSGRLHFVSRQRNRFKTRLIGDLGFEAEVIAFRAIRKVHRLLGHDSGFHNHLDEFYYPEIGRQVRDLQRRLGIDAVIVEYAFHSRAFLGLSKGVLRILDTHDSFADRHKAFVNTANKYGYWFSVPPAAESRAFRRADVVVAIQEEEERTFRQRLGAEPPVVATVSHILDLGGRVEDFTPSDFLFLGSGNDANIISLKGFVQNVMPLVRAAQPDIRLVLAGGICGKIEDGEGILKLGRVDNLKDAFARAPLSINPITLGTGINIKLLDALAAGVPTISTRTGVRGLSERYRRGVVIVEDNDHRAFADAILQLASSRDQRQELGNRAFEDAIEWNRQQMAVLDDILSGRQAG